MEGIQINMNEEQKMMKEIDMRKSMGPGGAAGCILREHVEQLTRPILSKVS